jgi:hypothetical protein
LVLLLVPALGHVLRRQWAHAVRALAIDAFLLGGCVVLARTLGTANTIFLAMLAVLPIWALQSYAAWPLSEGKPIGLAAAWSMIWRRALDIRYLGALFLLTAATDLYIIVANPEYALTIFCAKPRGLIGVLAKAQSPTLHVLIGYGFLRLRRWALLLYLAYAGFGLLNATVNYACLGYGRVRTAFLITLIAFTIYVIWRRRCFQGRAESEGAHAKENPGRR